MPFSFAEPISLWDGFDTDVSYEVFNPSTDSYDPGSTAELLIPGLWRAGSASAVVLETGLVPFSTTRLHIEAVDLGSIVPKVDDRVTETSTGFVWYVSSVDSQSQNTRYALSLSRSR